MKKIRKRQCSKNQPTQEELDCAAGLIAGILFTAIGILMFGGLLCLVVWIIKLILTSIF